MRHYIIEILVHFILFAVLSDWHNTAWQKHHRQLAVNETLRCWEMTRTGTDDRPTPPLTGQSTRCSVTRLEYVPVAKLVHSMVSALLWDTWCHTGLRISTAQFTLSARSSPEPFVLIIHLFKPLRQFHHVCSKSSADGNIISSRYCLLTTI
jgi:hypothetical protein